MKAIINVDTKEELLYFAKNAKEAMDKHIYYLQLKSKKEYKLIKSKHGYILEYGNQTFWTKDILKLNFN